MSEPVTVRLIDLLLEGASGELMTGISNEQVVSLFGDPLLVKPSEPPWVETTLIYRFPNLQLTGEKLVDSLSIMVDECRKTTSPYAISSSAELELKPFGVNTTLRDFRQFAEVNQISIYEKLSADGEQTLMVFAGHRMILFDGVEEHSPIAFVAVH